MERDTYEHGIPSWLDLSTSDLPGARDFYSALFGWDIQEGPPETGGYSMAHLKGRTVAGLAPAMHPGPPAWMHYVNVADADAVAAKVPAAGGQVILAPMDVLTFGRMSVFADPAGAVFGTWQPGDHPGAGLVNEPGAFCWSELITTDVAGAIDFYRSVFGWAAQGTAADPYVEFQLDGRSFAGLMAKPAEMPAEAPPFWGVYFAVDDTDATASRAAALGGSLVMAPTDIEPGRFAVLADPAGALFNVIALAQPPT
jgi:predicted enzyme related to lactoylglutathione lyase